MTLAPSPNSALLAAASSRPGLVESLAWLCSSGDAGGGGVVAPVAIGDAAAKTPLQVTHGQSGCLRVGASDHGHSSTMGSTSCESKHRPAPAYVVGSRRPTPERAKHSSPMLHS